MHKCLRHVDPVDPMDHHYLSIAHSGLHTKCQCKVGTALQVQQVCTHHLTHAACAARARMIVMRAHLQLVSPVQATAICCL